MKCFEFGRERPEKFSNEIQAAYAVKIDGKRRKDHTNGNKKF